MEEDVLPLNGEAEPVPCPPDEIGAVIIVSRYVEAGAGHWAVKTNFISYNL